MNSEGAANPEKNQGYTESEHGETTVGESAGAGTANPPQNDAQAAATSANSETKTAEAEGASEEGSNEEVSEVEQLKAENSELRDRVLRLMAEMENLRRRTEREKADIASYAISNFARDVLAIGDNLERALTAVPDEALQKDPTLKALHDGVGVTQRELHNVLERHHVRPIEAEGQRFDPNLHQAMFEIDNPDVPAGTVLQVVQPGYMIGERVLRPAMVGVSKGGPRVMAENKAETGAKAAEETADQTSANTAKTDDPGTEANTQT